MGRKTFGSLKKMFEFCFQAQSGSKNLFCPVDAGAKIELS